MRRLAQLAAAADRRAGVGAAARARGRATRRALSRDAPAPTGRLMAATADRTDHELVGMARDGSQEAFEMLVLRHGDRLYATLRGFGLTPTEADDVAQETLLRAWRGLGGFAGRSGFFTWVYRIAFNEAQRRLSHRPPADDLSDDALAVVADPRPATDSTVEHR